MDGVQAVLAARAQVLERAGTVGAGWAGGVAAPAGGGFGTMLERALAGVEASQAEAGRATEAFERGLTDDFAGVSLKRNAAAIDFQAALQIRNRLIGAYRDIMNMPV